MTIKGDVDTEARVTIEQSELLLDQVERARACDSSVVILPRKQADDGRGIYGEATVFLAKELRAEGLDATYLDGAENRLFEVKKSALAAAVLTVGLGVGSSAAWDGIKVILKRVHREDQTLEVTYLDLRQDGRQRAWTVRGRHHAVLDAIDKLREEPGRE